MPVPVNSVTLPRAASNEPPAGGVAGVLQGFAEQLARDPAVEGEQIRLPTGVGHLHPVEELGDRRNGFGVLAQVQGDVLFQVHALGGGRAARCRDEGVGVRRRPENDLGVEVLCVDGLDQRRGVGRGLCSMNNIWTPLDFIATASATNVLYFAVIG